MTPCDFCLLSKSKAPLKEFCFESNDDICKNGGVDGGVENPKEASLKCFGIEKNNGLNV